MEFKVGDIVRIFLEEDGLYPYNVPKTGTIGVIEEQIHHFGLEQLLGVKIPMSVVKWESGVKVTVFDHDLREVKVTDKLIELKINKLKGLLPYTGNEQN